MDNDEIVATQAVTDLAKAAAVSRVGQIVTLIETFLGEAVDMFPAADAVSLTKWPVYAQGWSDCRDKVLAVLTELRTTGDRFEAAFAALDGKQ